MIPRLLDMAGHGHDAGNHRLSVVDGAMERVGGGDVETLHADIGRAAIGWRFLVGQQLGELLDAAAGITGRHRPHLITGPAQATVMAAMASGLSSSIPIRTSRGARRCAKM
jgi:hypothetical protein